jgi:predicted  nucleic acid-binding Zn-ribbon protein
VKTKQFFRFQVSQNNSPDMHISLRLSSIHPANPSETCNIFNERMNVDQEVNILKENVKTVNDNIRSLDGTLIKHENSLQRLSQECSSLQTNFQQQSQSDRSFIEQTFLEIRQKMEDYHYTASDGLLMWRIENFSKKYGK